MVEPDYLSGKDISRLRIEFVKKFSEYKLCLVLDEGLTPVFGKRQGPNGVYAAVIPKWTAAMINGESVFINGDGETSRDFCYIENTVQMNILAATAPSEAKDEVYNVAVGDRATLNDLFYAIKKALENYNLTVSLELTYRDFRAGDVYGIHRQIFRKLSEGCVICQNLKLIMIYLRRWVGILIRLSVSLELMKTLEGRGL